MATSDPGEWELNQLKAHAQLLSSIQNKVFEQVERGSITDDIAKDAVNEIMPCIFAIESALIPFGSISLVSYRLEKAGYSKLAKKIETDDQLRELSVDLQRGSSRAALIARLYKEHGNAILSFADEIRNKEIIPKPYGKFVDFDMEIWVLACLLDFKDVFFSRGISAEIAEERDFEKRIDDLVTNRLADFARERNPISRVGWYGSMRVMKSISDLIDDIKRQQRELKQNPGLTIALEDVEDKKWESLIQELIKHDAIAETILLSTRAVCAFVVLAHDVLTFQKAAGDVSTYFDAIEQRILKSDDFAAFCLERLKKYTEPSRLIEEDIDAFIHLTGILAFALSKGYFSPQGSDDKNKLRENLKEKFGFENRQAIIGAIVERFSDVNQVLTSRKSKFYDKENWFVATANLQKLYEDDGKMKTLRKLQEKEAIGEDYSFKFLVALPIAVKAMAQLSIDERLDRMAGLSHDRWGELEFAPWLTRVEDLGDELVNAMLDIHIQRSGNTAWGVWKGAHDWTVTAAVVDALSLWCAALACRYALNEQTGIVTRRTSGTEGIPREDQEVVAAFFGLLKKHTTPSPVEAANSADRDSLEWLNILWRLSGPSGPALNFDTKNSGRPFLGLDNAAKVAALIKHIRDAGEDRGDVVKEVCGLIRKTLGQGKSDATQAALYAALYKSIVEKFPRAFSDIAPPRVEQRK